MRVTRCRLCLNKRLHPFLDLGRTALANSYVHPERLDQPEPTYPLRAVLCLECGLVQIDEEVPADDLFRHYLYVSGTSDLIHRHAQFLANHLARSCPLRATDLVLEAASNDGTVLKAFQAIAMRIQGVEPARNIAAEANTAGIPTQCDFFNARTAARLRAELGPAKLVLARHVLAHVNDLAGFVEGLRTVLDKDGLAAVEVPHLLPFWQHLEYDTIYHEHLCYFSLRVLDRLFQRHDLQLVDVLEVPIHGGSIVISAQPRGGPRQPAPTVARLLAREDEAGLHRVALWDSFAQRVQLSKLALRRELENLRASGRTLGGYGAPAKGMTLLSYCGIGRDLLPYLADRNPHKQGLLTPGHHIPIVPADRLLHDQPDTVLLLSWNFAAEIMEQQADYLKRGGRFLIPLPMPHYLGRSSPNT